METLGSQNPDLSSVLSSCEPELQELMRQIDIMINQQRTQWEAELRATLVQLKTAQEELYTSRELLQRKELEIALLQKQQEATKSDRIDLISKYEQQLQKVCEELNKLKRNYQKLQRKHLKHDGSGGSTKSPDQTEMFRLKEKIEESQRCSTEWEQQCIQYQKQLATMETENKRLNDEISLLKVHAVEKEELHATLDSQDLLMRRVSLERQKLRNESARFTQLLQAKDQVIRSLEDCLAAHGSAGVEAFRLDLEKTTAKLHSAQTSEAELKAELFCLKEKLEMVSRQRDDQSKTEQELRSVKAEYELYTSEMKRLRVELQRAQQTRSEEVEAMRREVSKLTSDLHQRDLTISSHSGSLSSINEQLRRELQRSEQRTAELKMTQAQLDTLKEENQHLKGLLQRQEDHSPKRGDPSLMALRESYISSLGGLEQENVQRRQELGSAPHQAPAGRLGASSSTSQEKFDHTQHTTCQQQAVVHRDNSDQRKAKEQGSGSSHEEEIQRLFKQLQVEPVSSTGQSLGGSQGSRTQSPALSIPSSTSSTEIHLTRRNSASSDSAAEGQGSTYSKSKEKGTSASLPTSPSGDMVSRFLEEESVRSRELLQRLDTHIHNMTENNMRTVSKYLPSTAGATDTTAVQNGQ